MTDGSSEVALGPAAPAAGDEPPWIGVVTVAYAAADFIAECLESLLASGYPRLKIVVVDNASPDDTVAALRGWASGERPFVHPEDWPIARAPVAAKPRALAEFSPEAAARASFEALAEVSLIRSDANRGYAGGVNVGLRALLPHSEIGLFWVLNPDCVVEPQTPAAYAEAARRAGRFALIGGRSLLFGEPAVVQTDGGRFRPWRGTGGSVNINRRADACAPPEPGAFDYVPGVTMLASRGFIERAGLMDESWFLYYEEIDWSFRRGDLPLLVEPEARVRHRAGQSIGSRSRDRALPAPLSVYMGSRNQLRFTARWRPWRLPAVYAAALATATAHYLPARAWPQLSAALRGLHGLPPPEAVRSRLDPSVWAELDRRRWT